MGNNIIIIQLRTGEIIITMTDDSEPMDDTNIELLKVEYPALVVPLAQQQGGQPGQIGFQKLFPFSIPEGADIRKSNIVTVSTPITDFQTAYEKWVTTVKAADAGIILP